MMLTVVETGVFSLQREEGASAGAAVADIDKRRAATCHGAQRISWSGGLHPHSEARGMLPILQRH